MQHSSFHTFIKYYLYDLLMKVNLNILQHAVSVQPVQHIYIGQYLPVAVISDGRCGPISSCLVGVSKLAGRRLSDIKKWWRLTTGSQIGIEQFFISGRVTPRCVCRGMINFNNIVEV